MEKFNNKNTSKSGGSDELSNQVIANKENEPIFSFFKLKPAKIKLTKWQRNSPNKGANHLLGKLGKKLPNKTKYILGNLTVLVNNQNGEIFSIHDGKFTFLIKPNFEKLDLENDDTLRIGETPDGSIDITSLGDKWILLDKVEKSMHEQVLMAAYQRTK